MCAEHQHACIHCSLLTGDAILSAASMLPLLPAVLEYAFISDLTQTLAYLSCFYQVFFFFFFPQQQKEINTRVKASAQECLLDWSTFSSTDSKQHAVLALASIAACLPLCVSPALAGVRTSRRSWCSSYMIAISGKLSRMNTIIMSIRRLISGHVDCCSCDKVYIVQGFPVAPCQELRAVKHRRDFTPWGQGRGPWTQGNLWRSSVLARLCFVCIVVN